MSNKKSIGQTCIQAFGESPSIIIVSVMLTKIFKTLMILECVLLRKGKNY